jgi:hypothetical protein
LRKTSADIYSTPDEFQTVLFEYEYIFPKRSVFDSGPDIIEVNAVRLKLPLLVTPSDIVTDIEVAVAQDLGWDPAYVKVVCQIQKLVIPSLNVETNEPLFI